MAWYKVGSVSVINGSTVVTAKDTRFASNVRVGDGFRGPDGEWYEVVNIASETVLGIYPAYQSATENDSLNYMIAPLQGYNKESADRLRAITESFKELDAELIEVQEAIQIVKVSETNTKASELAAKASETAAAASQVAAGISETKAKASETAAKSSENESKNSQIAAANSESVATLAANSASQSQLAAKGSEDAAKIHADNANLSETNAKASETAAKTSETNSKTSETSASQSASTATTAATNASNSATTAVNAKNDAEKARDDAIAAAGTVTGNLTDRGPVDLSSGQYPAKPATSSFWKVVVGGDVTVGGTTIDYGVGDTLVYSKIIDEFYKIDNTESVSSVNGKKGTVVINKTDVGLSNVDNTSDLNKPISTATQSALNTKEPVITPGVALQYYTGEKQWADLRPAVRNTTLLGFNPAYSDAVVASDTVLSALGKFQGQLNNTLKKGETGIGSTASPIVLDCNAVTVGGIYTLTTDTLNSPPAGSYTLFHEPHGSSGAFTQIAIGNGAGSAMWCRSNNGQWGRLLKTGDHGVGAIETTFVADVNSMPQTGQFRVDNSTLNLPTQIPGIVTCYSATAGNFIQIYIPAAGIASFDSFWFRSWANGVHSIWQQISKVGDFGIGATQGVTSVVDCNTSKTSGKYRTTPGTLNLPVAAFGTLEVSIYDSTNTTQIFTTLNSNGTQMYFRSESAGSWLPWTLIAKNSDVSDLGSRVTVLENKPSVEKVIPTWISSQTLNVAMAIVNGNLWTACGAATALQNIGAGRGLNNITRLYGVGNFSQPPVPSISKIIKVAGNGLNNLFLTESGELFAVGLNNLGQAGLNNTSVVPVPTLTNTGVLDVYYEPSCNAPNADSSKSVIRKSDGIYVCGYNANGNLGAGDTVNKTTWTKVWHDGLVKDPNVAAYGEVDAVWNLGATYGCIFIRSKDNRLFAAGYNANGQLGDGSVTQRNSFFEVTANWGGTTEVAKIIKMLGGYGYADTATQVASCTYALLPDGYRFTGSNTYGQAGNGSVTQTTTPIKITMPEAAKEFYVQGGGVTSCFWVGTSGKLWVWGRNTEYALGNGTNTNVTVPTIHPFFNGTSSDRTIEEILNKGGFSRQGYTYYGMTFIKTMDKSVYHMGVSGDYESGTNSNSSVMTQRRVMLPNRDSTGSIADYTHISIVDSTWSATGSCSIHCYNSVGDCYVWGYNGYSACVQGADGTSIPVPMKVRPGWV